MDQAIHTVMKHPFLAIAAYAVFSNAVGTMPLPTEKSSAGYGWLYRFAHGLASNLQYAWKVKFPAAPMETAKP